MRNALFLLTLSISLPFASFVHPLAAHEHGTDAEWVTPNEDLMQEHGLLQRVLLIYQEIAKRLAKNQEFPISCLKQAAQIIQDFIEEHHEYLEEEYVFPLLREHGQCEEIIVVLLEQHQAGRRITQYILDNAQEKSLKNPKKRAQLQEAVEAFVRMYRPHAAREDTIIFPAFKKLLSREEYEALGDFFEELEHELLGSDGIEQLIRKVESIEKSLQIYHLGQYTTDAPKS